jgi:hypothetical protein
MVTRNSQQPRREELSKKYALLGRMTSKSDWYGLGTASNKREVLKGRARCIRKGWRATNLKVVCDIKYRFEVKL